MMNKDKISIYLFNWPGQFENTNRLVDMMESRWRTATTIIASGQYENSNVRVININEDSYYGEQFKTAIEDFGKDIMLLIQSDVSIEDFTRFIQRCLIAFEDKELGVWEPNIDFTSWKTPIVSTGEIDHDGCVEIISTDSTCWAIKKIIVEEMKINEIRYSHFGWGIDLIANSIAHDKKLKIKRDLKVLVKHPRSTNYNSQRAGVEAQKYFDLQPTNLKFQLSKILSHTKAESLKHDRKIKTMLSNLRYLIQQLFRN